MNMSHMGTILVSLDFDGLDESTQIYGLRGRLPYKSQLVTGLIDSIWFDSGCKCSGKARTALALCVCIASGNCFVTYIRLSLFVHPSNPVSGIPESEPN